MGFLSSLLGGITGSTQAKASREAGEMQLAASREANAEAARQFNIGQQNLTPYMQAGQQFGLNPLAAGMQSGDLTRSFGLSDFQADPGYNWIRQQGLDGLQSQAAARGSLLSGSTLKGLADYNQNLAAQQWQNSYSRFNNDQSNRFARLSGLATMGQNSAAGQAANGMQYAGIMGDNLTSGAAAMGQGAIGAANARTQGSNNILSNGLKLFGFL